MGIILLTLLEVYFAYKVFTVYNGIYQVGIFTPLLFQSYVYYRLFREGISCYKKSIAVLGLITIILNLTIYFTLPNYTYDEGKQIVQQYMGISRNGMFVNLSFDKNTVPLINNPKQLFVSDRAYYYEITSTEERKYFIVNPLTGELTQLSEGYWKYVSIKCSVLKYSSFVPLV